MTSEQKINLVILGSTGSIGEQALEIVDLFPEKYNILALSAHQNFTRFSEQLNKYKPPYAAIADNSQYKLLRESTSAETEVLSGSDSLQYLASLSEADIILQAISGAAGIAPTIAAVKTGKRIALANKESLVAAGDIIMKMAEDYAAEIIPVDSEHSAIFQCLKNEDKYVDCLWLTASGGPFKDYSQEQLDNVTPEMALKHPNWKMGAKITVDSATMMNKGLEVIEAHHLFNQPYDKIKVIIQKESIIHSMVEFVDGSFIAHLGAADMRIPIQYAFTYPQRSHSLAKHLDFYDLNSLSFAQPDLEKFPSLGLAYAAGKQGGTMPAVLNAANEAAVKGFLEGKIKFKTIPDLVARVMDKHPGVGNPGIEDILAADNWARDYSRHIIRKEGDV